VSCVSVPVAIVIFIFASEFTVLPVVTFVRNKEFSCVPLFSAPSCRVTAKQQTFETKQDVAAAKRKKIDYQSTENITVFNTQ